MIEGEEFDGNTNDPKALISALYSSISLPPPTPSPQTIIPPLPISSHPHHSSSHLPSISSSSGPMNRVGSYTSNSGNTNNVNTFNIIISNFNVSAFDALMVYLIYNLFYKINFFLHNLNNDYW